MSSGRYHRLLFAIMALAVLALTLAPLVLRRHFQPDEFLFATSIHMFNLPLSDRYHEMVNLYMLPLSWLTRLLSSSTAILILLRITYAGLFLLSLGLLAGTYRGERRPFWGTVLLLSFVFMHPIFLRFGLEIRHETFIVLGLVMLQRTFVAFCERPEPRYALYIGFVLGLLTTCAYKALVYSVPLLAVALAGTYVISERRLRPLGIVLLGYLGPLLLSVACYGFTDSFDDHVRMVLHYVRGTETSMKISKLDFFWYLVRQDPLTATLLCGIGATLVVRIRTLPKIPRATLVFSLATFSTILALITLNPAPFFYNGVTVTVAALLVLLTALPHYSQLLRPRYVAPFLLAQALFFLVHRLHDPYLAPTAARQFAYIETAELLLGPGESYLDGVGMLAARKQVDADWQIYNAKMADYRAGKIKTFGAILNEARPPVVITNYRWSWLPKEDTETLRTHYLKVAPDFWVLGGVVLSPTGVLDVRRAGRYELRSLNAGRALVLNGEVVDFGIRTLEVGRYEVRENTSGLVWIWLGPTLSGLPDLNRFPAQEPLIFSPF